METASISGRGRVASDRRSARRRSIPYLRGAVLEAEGRSHVVVVTDFGPDGAFLSSRAPLGTAAAMRLKVILPGDGREVLLPCEVVWRSERFDPATGRPAGVAVRFQGLDADAVRRVEEFTASGFLPAADSAPADHFEYRVLERGSLDAHELNLLGLDGWAVAATLPTAEGVRIVLMRRL